MTHLTLLETNWTPLDSDATMPQGIPGEVDRLIETALSRFLSEWPWLMPQRDDLRQDARIMVATRPTLQASIAHPGRFVYELCRDLVDSKKGAAATDHRLRTTFSDIAPDPGERNIRSGKPSRPQDKAAVDAFSHFEALLSGSTYSAREVRVLLPSVFDPMYGLGYTRGTSEGTLRRFHPPALVADIRSAWAYALLTTKQRQALLVTIVLGYAQREAGALLGISRQAISDRADGGMNHLLRFLNGVEEVADQQLELAAA